MSKFLKSKSSLFAALAALATLAPLLVGQEQSKMASHQDSISTSVQSTQEKVTDVSGIVKSVDYGTREVVIELSGEDSRRLGGITEAKIHIGAGTRIEDVDNTKGTINTIMTGAPLEIKVAAGSDFATATKVEAAKIELSIACKEDQGCTKSGECGRSCPSDACACPMSKSKSSPSTP